MLNLSELPMVGHNEYLSWWPMLKETKLCSKLYVK